MRPSMRLNSNLDLGSLTQSSAFEQNPFLPSRRHGQGVRFLSIEKRWHLVSGHPYYLDLIRFTKYSKIKGNSLNGQALRES